MVTFIVYCSLYLALTLIVGGLDGTVPPQFGLGAMRVEPGCASPSHSFRRLSEYLQLHTDIDTMASPDPALAHAQVVKADDSFELYDLRVEIICPPNERILCGAKDGDYFTLEGEMLKLPPGQGISIYSLSTDMEALNTGWI